MTNKVLFLVRGLPGSGKSTFANIICENVFSSDMFFEKNGLYAFDASEVKESHQWCENQVKNHMSEGIERIAVANTFTQEWEMFPYFDMAEIYGYQVHTIIIENYHGSQNIHGVTTEKIQFMRDKFEIRL